MGFLDKILKREVKELLTNVVEKAVDGFTGENQQSSVSTRNDSNEQSGEAGLRSRLEKVVEEQFNTYELKKNVSSSVLDAPRDAVDYSYAIYKNGNVVAVINIIQNRNDYSLKRFRLAKEAAQNKGIPHMNFFSHLPNTSEYISQRLRENIL